MVAIFRFIQKQIYFFSFNSLVILLIINLIAIPVIQLLQQSNYFNSVAYAQEEIALVDPPPPPLPVPGEEYHLSSEQEAQLANEKIEIETVTKDNEIPATIELKGRQWFSCVDQTICNSPEMRIVTSIEKVKDLDILILLGIVGASALARVIVLGFALVGPKVTSFVTSAHSAIINWVSLGGVAGAINAGMLNAYTRYQTWSLWFRIPGGFSLGFLEFLGCRLVTRSSCEAYMSPPSTRFYLPAKGIPSAVSNRDITVPFRLVTNNLNRSVQISPSLATRIANSLGYFNRVDSPSDFGMSVDFQKYDELQKIFLNLKIYLHHSPELATRYKEQAQSQVLAARVPGTPGFERSYGISDIPNQDVRIALVDEGFNLTWSVAVVTKYIDGVNIGEYFAKGGRLTGTQIDNFLKTLDGVFDATGKGPGYVLDPQSLEFSALSNIIVQQNTGKLFLMNFGSGTWSLPDNFFDVRSNILKVLLKYYDYGKP